MNNKQYNVLNKVLDSNKLGRNCIFIQFRNLLEFKSFYLERLNPNHHILLYGKRKKKYNKGNNYIKVGELLFPFALLIFNLSTILQNILFACISMYFLLAFLFMFYGNINILKVNRC